MSGDTNPIVGFLLNLVAALVIFNAIDLIMGAVVWQRPYQFELIQNLVLPAVIGTVMYAAERRHNG